MRVQQTAVVGKPLDAVFGYLSDFTTTTEWDTTSFRRADGDTEVTYAAELTFRGS